MAKLYVDTIEPEGATTTLTVGESGQNTVIAGAGIKANVVKDAGANAIASIDIPGLVSGFFDSRKANRSPIAFLNSASAREASDW